LVKTSVTSIPASARRPRDRASVISHIRRNRAIFFLYGISDRTSSSTWPLL
jgi:hypothetical protein